MSISIEDACRWTSSRAMRLAPPAGNGQSATQRATRLVRDVIATDGVLDIRVATTVEGSPVPFAPLRAMKITRLEADHHALFQTTLTTLTEVHSERDLVLTDLDTVVGQVLVIRATNTLSNLSTHVLYGRWGEPATPTHHDVSSGNSVDGVAELLVSDARDEPFYLHLSLIEFATPKSGATRPKGVGEVIVSSFATDVAITGIHPSTVGTAERFVHAVIEGAGFNETMRFRFSHQFDEDTIFLPIETNVANPTRAEVLLDFNDGVFLGEAAVFDDNELPEVASRISVSGFAPLQALKPGVEYKWRVEARNEFGDNVGPVWTFTTAGESTGVFIRGDVDLAGAVDITDALNTLDFLFLGGFIPGCLDAVDAGLTDLSDPLRTLTFLFLGGVEIPRPGPFDCGADPTVDGLGCENEDFCE